MGAGCVGGEDAVFLAEVCEGAGGVAVWFVGPWCMWFFWIDGEEIWGEGGLEEIIDVEDGGGGEDGGCEGEDEERRFGFVD